MEKNKSPLIVHFKELRNRFFFCILAFLGLSIISYFYAGNIYAILVKPLSDIEGAGHKMIYTNLTEAFFTYLKLSLFAGFAFSIPIIVSQIYLFISPGLLPGERKIILSLFCFSPLLFLLGAVLVYTLVFPLAWKFFLSFETITTNGIEIHLEAKVSEYLSLVTHLIVAFGLSFQLPIILAVLAKIGIVNDAWLKKKRRIAIVIIFAVAAVITPPDVISQIALALPLVILYELSIIACKMIQRRE